MKFLSNYINENLKSHDYHKLQHELLSVYGNEIKSFEDGTKKDANIKSFDILVNGDFKMARKIAKILSEEQQFKNMLNFYNYYISSVGNGRIFVEPSYTKIKNDYIYNKCNCILWHLTDNEHVKSILRNGLKARTANYRNYPSRIYVFATDTNNNDIRNNPNEVTEFIDELGIHDNLEEFTLLKIDLSKTQHNIDFYEDTAMQSTHVFYTYTNIPPQFIEIVDFDRDNFINKF